jgi:hypothetical protein
MRSRAHTHRCRIRCRGEGGTRAPTAYAAACAGSCVRELILIAAADVAEESKGGGEHAPTAYAAACATSYACAYVAEEREGVRHVCQCVELKLWPSPSLNRLTPAARMPLPRCAHARLSRSSCSPLSVFVSPLSASVSLCSCSTLSLCLPQQPDAGCTGDRESRASIQCVELKFNG